MMSIPTGWSGTSNRPRVRYTTRPASHTETAARAPERRRAPRRARPRRLADSDLSSPTSGHEYAFHDGHATIVERSSLSRLPMANGFFLNETASAEIRAERRMVRHSGNSSDTTRQFSPIGPRLFRNTEQ